MRTTPALAGLLAMLALAPGMALAVVEGTITVDPDRSVSGSFSETGTQKWTVNLERGKSYAVWGSPTGNANPTVNVQAASGGVLARFMIGLESGGHGASFRAPYTGLYTVAVACDAGCYYAPA